LCRTGAYVGIGIPAKPIDPPIRPSPIIATRSMVMRLPRTNCAARR
jgi:hypothetical protein